MREIFTGLILLIATFSSGALMAFPNQFSDNPEENIAFNKPRVFLTLNHEHENFFGKAFSYQGISTGVILQNGWSMGLFLSTFASNLKVKIEDKPMFVNAWKNGFLVGKIFRPEKRFHPGLQLTAGNFNLGAADKKMNLFSISHAANRINGLVVSPEIYGEVDICQWFSVRTGLAWSYYNYPNDEVIQKSDLNNLSFDFGFIFKRKG
jgi:hypothetical protein